MNKEIVSKDLANEGYIVYSKTDDNAIEYIDKEKALVCWTYKPACYKVYRTEAEARKDLKYAQIAIEEYLKYTNYKYKYTQVEDDDLQAFNAMILSNRLADADVYKVKKAVRVEIEGV